MSDQVPTPHDIACMAAAANEGIPVAACARIFQYPLEVVYDILKDHRAQGNIAELPRPDWTPGSKKLDHQPEGLSNTDLEFNCTKVFRLTRLESAFLLSLLRYSYLEKTRLHAIVEHQRATRATQPDEMEVTDIKMVDVMICKLRKKLKSADDGFIIKTLWGKGYYIDPPIKARLITFVTGEAHEGKESTAAPDEGIDEAA